MGNCFSDVNDQRGAVGSSSGGRGNFVSASSKEREAADAASLLTGAANFSSWVEIRAACRDLKQKDTLSKSDPMAVLYEEVQPGGKEREIGRTEVVPATHNPTFTVAFRLLYNFEKVQRLRLMVVDIDSGQDPKTVDPMKCDFLGDCWVVLSELVTSKDHNKTYTLNTHSAHVSKALLSVEELSSARDVITCQISAVGLKNVELVSKSDPLLEICKRPQGDGPGVWQPLFRTEVCGNNLNPIWKPFTIRATQLNNGDPYRPLLLRVMDFEDSGKHRPLGQVEVTASKLEAASKSQTPLPLSGPNGASGTGHGSLMVRSWQVVSQPSFLDYIRAGTEISFLLAVDFTGSNRSPTDPTSLHYAKPGGYTPYEEALCGVGRVLEYYDSDRQFPAFGFGGHRRGAGVSHCFPLNDRPDALCDGVSGIMAAYRQALSSWDLSGPTLFHPVINAACSIASQPCAHLKYNVLLILTDGEIMDMKETIESIITASGLPMSVLIVGIGNADFANMEKLDGDKKALIQDGRVAERDIVQFVEFKKFANNGDALAAEVLAELPGQFLAYVRARNIPLPQHQAPATAPPL